MVGNRYAITPRTQSKSFLENNIAHNRGPVQNPAPEGMWRTFATNLVVCEGGPHPRPLSRTRERGAAPRTRAGSSPRRTPGSISIVDDIPGPSSSAPAGWPISRLVRPTSAYGIATGPAGPRNDSCSLPPTTHRLPWPSSTREQWHSMIAGPCSPMSFVLCPSVPYSLLPTPHSPLPLSPATSSPTTTGSIPAVAAAPPTPHRPPSRWRRKRS